MWYVQYQQVPCNALLGRRMAICVKRNSVVFCMRYKSTSLKELNIYFRLIGGMSNLALENMLTFPGLRSLV
jgi:hypothetical protein